MTTPQKPAPRKSAAVLITEEIERLRVLHREADGLVSDEAVNVDLSLFIQANQPMFFDPDALARTKHTQYQESRTLFRKGRAGDALQMPMPNFEGIWQLGNNTSVTVGIAKRNHLTMRQKLIVSQNVPQQAAYTREYFLIETALDRMQGPDDTFGDVMGKDYESTVDAAGG
jgi:hypothetical protein